MLWVRIFGGEASLSHIFEGARGMAKLSPTLSHLNADRVYKIILKSFVRPNVVPKELSAAMPTLTKHFHLLNYKGKEKKKILKALKTVRSASEIDVLVPDFFDFHRPVHPENFAFCEKALMSISPRLPPNCIECLFAFGFRLFLHTMYLLEEDIEKVLCGNWHASQSSVLPKYSVVLFYLAKFEGEYRLKFLDVVPKFLGVFDRRWRDVFQSKKSELQRDFLNIFICLVPIVQAEKQERKEFSLVWLVNQLDLLVKLLEDGTYKFDVEHSFRSILTGFLALVTMSEKPQRIQMGSIATRALRNISIYSDIPSECLFVGGLAVSLYNECARYMNSDAVKAHLEAVLEYAAWIIVAFPENEVQKRPDEGNEKEAYELGRIGLAVYFEKAETVKDIPCLQPNKQLGAIIDHINSICKGSKDESRLVADIIDSVQKKAEVLHGQQFRGYLVFVLESLRRIDEEKLYTGFGKKWDPLLSEDVFPKDLASPHSRDLQAVVSAILFRSFLYDAESRADLFTLFYKFVLRQKRFSEVMPILNSLMTSDKSSEFYDTLVPSSLFAILIKESDKNVRIFDFIRNITYCKPEKCFASESLSNFLAHNYWKQPYRESVLLCLTAGLKVCGSESKYHQLLNSVLTTIAIILTTGYSRESTECNPLLDAFADSLDGFCPRALDCCLENAVLDMVARFFVKYEDHETLEVAIKVLRGVEFQTWRTKQLFNWPKFSVNSVLTTILSVDSTVDFGRYLMKLASDSRGCFVNDYALKLLLKWIAGKRTEKQTLQELFAKCAIDTSNVLHLQRAGAVEAILERLVSVDNEEIATALCDLFYLVSCETFSASGVYRLIEILKIPRMKWQKKVVEIVRRLLKPVKNKQDSFFYLDGCHTGLFTTSIEFNKKLVFQFECKFDNTNTPLYQPVVTIPMKQGSSVGIGLKDRLLVVKVGGKIVGAFKSSFVNTLLYTIAIVLSSNSVQLLVNNKKDENVIEIPEIEQTKVSVCFGARGKKDQLGLICHISYVSIHNDYCGPEKSKELRNTKDLLGYYHPVNVNEGFCTATGPVGRQMAFQGIAIHNCLTLQSVIPHFHFLLNFMPLLSRLQNKEEWPIIDDGVMFLNLVLKLISKSLTDADVQSRFSFVKGIQIMSAFLMQIDVEFLKESVFETLIGLFKGLNSNLQKEMTVNVWLNFDFIHRLDPKIEKCFLSEWIYSLLDVGNSFVVIDSYDFLLYYLMVFYSDESEISLLAWKLAITLLRTNITPSTAGSLLALPIAIESGNLLLLAVTMVSDLLKENNESVIKMIQEHDCLVPFVVILAKNSALVQLKSLECIDYIASNLHVDHNALETAVCQAVVIFQESDNVESIVNYLADLLEMGKWQYFPLFCHTVRMLSNDLAKIYCSRVGKAMLSASSKFIAAANNTWPIWMLMFTSTLYMCHTDPRNLASVIAMLISKDAYETG